MRKIYTAIDLGSDSIKIVVGEMFREKLNVLAAVLTPSKGIKRGLIVDANEAISSLKTAIEKVEGKLGIRIKRAIVNYDSHNLVFEDADGYSTLTNQENKVYGEDVTRCLQACVYNKISEDEELVNVLPIDFCLDGKSGIRDPKGMVGKKLGVRALLIKTHKKKSYSIITILESLGIEVVDTYITPIGDYYAYAEKEFEKQTGAIINIGADITTVSVYEKGLLKDAKIIPLGGNNIDNDLVYLLKIKNEDAKLIKETFALANKSYAQNTEVYEVFDRFKKEIKLNQFEISDIVMSRVMEILKFSKKQISLLTKQENSYIIVTGGTSELLSMTSLVKEVLGDKAKVGNIDIIGIRDNRYASLLGMIKYFHYKLSLKAKEYTMFNQEDLEDLITNKSKTIELKEDSVLNKVFGYFFDK